MLDEGELSTIFNGGLRVFPIFQDNGSSLAEYYWGNGYTQAPAGELSFNQIEEYKGTDGTDTFWLERDAHRIGSDPRQSSVNRRAQYQANQQRLLGSK
ncbi:hypothetical protein ADK65_20450 [Streptomyces sp. NRRL B-1140]|nr:hypothetical protein ADK65_20450 [Streptomyces sp. NRRL B-1140]